MEFQEVIRLRYSARAYKADVVEDEKLEQVLEACRLAPTAANRQPFQIIVIRSRGREEELATIYDRSWFVKAPLVICICALPDQAWVHRDGKNYCDVDVSIAMDHLVLAATNAGLGTCWVAAFNRQAAREILGLPDGVEPIAFTPLGYAADEPRPKKRKALTELVRYERW